MADLRITICGIEFPNPIWTAAGPTGKDAAMLLRAAAGGAGGLVAKTISVTPARVPIPNIASPFAGSLLNAELWSEMDYRPFIEKELAMARTAHLPVIASVGYSPEDLAVLGKALEDAGTADAVEFSIHYVEKDAAHLRQTALSLKQNFNKPVFAKLSPAIQDLSSVLQALDDIVDGYVAINSLGPALDFDIVTLRPSMGSQDGRGWLSGRAILPIGLHFVEAISSLSKKPVIGVGGIRRVEDVVKYIMAGASAVQICSLAILKGQNVYGKLARQLADWMDKHGYATIEDLRGVYQRRTHRPQHVLEQGPQLYPAISYDLCTYCDLCTKSCVHFAIRFQDKLFLLDRSKCVSCGLCASVCPTAAFDMTVQVEV
jgi:dihydroorotate dehydrogenase subfamily 1